MPAGTAAAPAGASDSATSTVATTASGAVAATPKHVGALSVAAPLVPLNDAVGRRRLLTTPDKQSYWALSQYFETQRNEAYCSVATSVMTLNALGIQRPATALYPGYPYFTQDDFFNSIDPSIANAARVSHEGMTLDQLSSALGSFPVTVQKYHAGELSLVQFRQLIRRTTTASGQYVLLNFRRDQIGEIGGGHWSPLAAYDPGSDSALLMDVARYKYPPVWVPLARLYRGAVAVDSVSNLSRGVIVIGKHSAG